MTAVCRIGDTIVGVCEAPVSGHPRDCTGTWNTGSSTVKANGIGVIRTGDIGTTDCGHTFQAISGSAKNKTNGMGLQRVGDPVTILEGGSGVSVSGSGDVFSK